MIINYNKIKQKKVEDMTIEEYLKIHPELNLNSVEASLNNLEKATETFNRVFGKEPTAGESTYITALREKENLDLEAVSRQMGRNLGFEIPSQTKFEKKHDEQEFERYQKISELANL